MVALPVLENDGDLGKPLAGDSLRSKKHPSVAELLAQRANEITRKQIASIVADATAETACRLTLCLAKWDLKAAVPDIRHRVAEYLSLVAHWRTARWP